MPVTGHENHSARGCPHQPRAALRAGSSQSAPRRL